MVAKKATDEQICNALIKSGGVITDAAIRLGMAASTLGRRILTNQDLLDAREQGRQDVLDAAETELFKAVRSGKPWAVRFVLGRLGKGRGYGASLEVAGAALGRVVVYLPDDGREQPETGGTGGSDNSGSGDPATTGTADNGTAE